MAKSYLCFIHLLILPPQLLRLSLFLYENLDTFARVITFEFFILSFFLNVRNFITFVHLPGFNLIIPGLSVNYYIAIEMSHKTYCYMETDYKNLIQ